MRVRYAVCQLPGSDQLIADVSVDFAMGRHNRVLDMPYYNPVMLARRISTLDVLSGGRARLGLGLGWSTDEHDALGAEMKHRGARADEFLQVLKAIWTTDPAVFQGRFNTLPKSHIYPKPVQKPHPPIYMGAFVPAALERIAKYGDGWNPEAIPVAGMEQMFDGIKQMAKAAGRDPAKLALIVRRVPRTGQSSSERWSRSRGTLRAAGV
jgi:alkanesulfonate monooxygenase SsuD/methylene tetrahydromethanopterin reductase-like flavin-dependent oxidoreductase (luciferase family)